MQTIEITEAKTLLEFLMGLLSDDDALAEFREDPAAALKAAGLEGICVEDIEDLMPGILEKFSAEDCAKYENDCDEDKCHDDKWHDKHEHGHHEGKHHDECHDDKWDHHDHEISKVITHLTYVTNNFTIDNSINIGAVWTDGGDFVLVGGDNNGNIITGDDNIVTDTDVNGHGNVVGDNNGSGNLDVDATVNADLGLLPLGGLPDVTGALGGLTGGLTGAAATPFSAASLPDGTEDLDPGTEEPEDTEDGGDSVLVKGDNNGNIVTGDNNFVDSTTVNGDGNTVGNGNGSGNVDIDADVDLGGGEGEGDGGGDGMDD